MVSAVATPSLPSLLNQDLSYKFREDVHQRRLEQVQGEHRGLGVLSVGPVRSPSLP
jgi:hypothetical protein